MSAPATELPTDHALAAAYGLRVASLDEVLRAQVAIIMFSSAYLAEAIRGGLQARGVV